MNTPIIRGITPVNLEQHAVIADYRPQASDDAIHVIEIANGVASHLQNRIAVFGRWITLGELDRRIHAYTEDPKQYTTDHLRSLSK